MVEQAWLTSAFSTYAKTLSVTSTIETRLNYCKKGFHPRLFWWHLWFVYSCFVHLSIAQMEDPIGRRPVLCQVGTMIDTLCYHFEFYHLFRITYFVFGTQAQCRPRSTSIASENLYPRRCHIRPKSQGLLPEVWRRWWLAYDEVSSEIQAGMLNFAAEKTVDCISALPLTGATWFRVAWAHEVALDVEWGEAWGLDR